MIAQHSPLRVYQEVDTTIRWLVDHGLDINATDGLLQCSASRPILVY
jgi:hypothetical protein